MSLHNSTFENNAAGAFRPDTVKGKEKSFQVSLNIGSQIISAGGY